MSEEATSHYPLLRQEVCGSREPSASESPSHRGLLSWGGTTLRRRRHRRHRRTCPVSKPSWRDEARVTKCEPEKERNNSKLDLKWMQCLRVKFNIPWTTSFYKCTRQLLWISLGIFRGKVFLYQITLKGYSWTAPSWTQMNKIIAGKNLVSNLTIFYSP